MAKIGLFGGTFNPIHKGHILFVTQIKERYGLDKVFLIPSNIPPHKYSALATKNERFIMCKLATENIGYINVCDIEYKLGQKSYTFNTLNILKKSYPNDEIYLIIGSDMLHTFDQWYNYKLILNMAFVVSGASSADEHELMKDKARALGSNVLTTVMDILPVSSTYVRIRFAQGLKCTEYLDEKVEKYILENQIYMKDDSLFVECYNAAKNQLSEKRFKHSLMVSKAAAKLAEIYDEDPQKAKIAGILHDIMKDKDDDFLLRFMNKNGIILNEFEKKCPKIWHSFAAAVYSKNYLGIEDKDIINSIKYHTIAKKGMSKFEKIIYMADCISADRKYDGVRSLRKTAKKNLDKAMFIQLSSIITNFCKQGFFVHPNTIECYNELCINKTN